MAEPEQPYQVSTVVMVSMTAVAAEAKALMLADVCRSRAWSTRILGSYSVAVVSMSEQNS